jgi:5,5'-dehydrodivanillate O-demethylase oxygenase subunit
MLTQQQNEQLTRVGPGTPCGELMRRYWHPVATCQELKANPVKAVRILGESLTLFRDRQERLGLIGQRCAHRRVDLRYGIPEMEGLRCPYHGWLYDLGGRCLEQPAEVAESDFRKSIKLPSYPVEELGGLVWAYLGPQPAPLLPRWDLFVVDHAFRMIGTTLLPCNWLQCQENAVDTVHTEWVHGRLGQYALERKGVTDPRKISQAERFRRHHVKFDFAPVEVGIQKLRLVEGESEDAENWRVGHPMVFPNYVRIGQLGYSEFQIRVPLDDTHTWHLAYHVYFPGEDVDVPKQDPVPAFDVPLEELPDFVLGQDLLCWVAQGDICDRTQEQLGTSDRGVVMFRRLLTEQIEVVRKGGDPINTFRDPEANRCINLLLEERGSLASYRKGSVRYMNTGANSPVLDELDELMMKGAEAAKAKAAP